jgi:hypothetical protein
VLSDGKWRYKKYELSGKGWLIRIKMAAVMLAVLALTVSLSGCAGLLAACNTQTG